MNLGVSHSKNARPKSAPILEHKPKFTELQRSVLTCEVQTENIRSSVYNSAAT